MCQQALTTLNELKNDLVVDHVNEGQSAGFTEVGGEIGVEQRNLAGLELTHEDAAWIPFDLRLQN